MPTNPEAWKFGQEKLKPNSETIGFIGLWKFGNFGFIEHVAIRKDLRERGLGTKLMKKILGRKMMVLETESPKIRIARRRVNFYNRNGFKPVRKRI